MNLGASGPVLAFPSIDLIATTGQRTPCVLQNRTIDVWGFSLDGSSAAAAQCRAWLSEDERARSIRFVRQDDQIRYVLAHGGLRALLASYAGLDPAHLSFQSGPTGKPALLDGPVFAHSLRFNLSHSHGRMLIAVAREQDVGVDLEQLRDRIDVVKLAERFYTSDEYERVLRLSGSNQVRQFYRYWVAKEAVLKGQGVGLRSLQQCGILTAEMPSRAVAQVSPDSAMLFGWTIQWIDCGTGWVGALAAPGGDWAVRAMTV